MKRIAIALTFFLFSVSAKAANVEEAASRASEIQEVEALPYKKKINVLCASLAAYRETRSESFGSQKLIAALVYTRAETDNTSTCKVVEKPHQFPWAKQSVHAILPSVKEREAWEQSQKAALVEYGKHPHVEYTVTRRAFRKFKGVHIFARMEHVVFYNISQGKTSYVVHGPVRVQRFRHRRARIV